MVRLKDRVDSFLADSEQHFNSNMVRLKVAESNTITPPGVVFQFQHGAIKSNVRSILPNTCN